MLFVAKKYYTNELQWQGIADWTDLRHGYLNHGKCYYDIKIRFKSVAFHFIFTASKNRSPKDSDICYMVCK